MKTTIGQTDVNEIALIEFRGPLKNLQQQSSAKMRESCAGNQQPAQPLHVPTTLSTEGPTGFYVSDSRC